MFPRGAGTGNQNSSISAMMPLDDSIFSGTNALDNNNSNLMSMFNAGAAQPAAAQGPPVRYTPTRGGGGDEQTDTQPEMNLADHLGLNGGPTGGVPYSGVPRGGMLSSVPQSAAGISGGPTGSDAGLAPRAVNNSGLGATISPVAPPPAPSPYSSPFTTPGANPYLENPTGTNTYPVGTQGGLGGQVTNYNPTYFASDETAANIAKAAGGTVVSGNDLVNAPGSPFILNQGENMVQLQNGLTLNAGLINSVYNNGYNSTITDQNLANALNFGPNGAGKGVYTVKDGQITYDANGTPQMLGTSAPGSMIQQAGAPLTQAQLQAAFQGQAGTPGYGQPSPSQGMLTGGQTTAPASGAAPLQQPGSAPQTFNPAMNQPFPNTGQTSTNGQPPNYAGFQMPGFGTGSGPDQYLSALAQSGVLPLAGIIGQGGMPINQMPAWQSMIDAQQRNIQEGRNQLQAQFDAGGGRFSSAFGTASTDYQNQATASQNALLAQMTAQAQQQAVQNLLQASGQAAGIGSQAGNQLSAQDFQSQMQQYGISAQMAQLLASQSGSAAQMMAQLGYGANQSLNQNASGAAGQLFGAENNSALQMYNAQNQLLPAFMQNQLQNQQLGLQTSQQLSDTWMRNLGLGAQLGQQNYQNQQNDLNAQMQQWLYSQPQNNPFLQMMFQAATYYPSPNMPSYAPGWFGQALQAAGQVGSAAVAASDERLKEDFTQIGELQGLPVYHYKFKNTPFYEIGMKAQEVAEKFPDAVIVGDERNPWLIKVDTLIEHFMKAQVN